VNLQPGTADSLEYFNLAVQKLQAAVALVDSSSQAPSVYTATLSALQGQAAQLQSSGTSTLNPNQFTSALTTVLNNAIGRVVAGGGGSASALTEGSVILPYTMPYVAATPVAPHVSPPVVSLSANTKPYENGLTNDSTIYFSSTGTLPIVLAQCSLNSGAYVACSTLNTFSTASLKPGTYTLSVRVEDAFGNVSAAKAAAFSVIEG
jgi:hypothetical protein